LCWLKNIKNTIQKQLKIVKNSLEPSADVKHSSKTFKTMKNLTKTFEFQDLALISSQNIRETLEH
jgi:hypothetical protein